MAEERKRSRRLARALADELGLTTPKTVRRRRAPKPASRLKKPR